MTRRMSVRIALFAALTAAIVLAYMYRGLLNVAALESWVKSAGALAYTYLGYAGREAVAGVSLYFEDIAPMASNSTDSVQSSSSPPPANIVSARPSMISSAALPMQCAEVEQAELIE